MKKLPLVLLSCAILPLCGRADLTITQDIAQQGSVSNPGSQSVEVVTKLKGTKARVDMGPQMSSIVDVDTADTISLLHPQKKALKVPGEMLRQMMAANKKEGTPAGEVKSTGKKETINGFACEVYETTAFGSKVTVWVTKDQPEAEKAVASLAKMANESDPLGSVLLHGNIQGFPVKVLVENPAGGSITSSVKTISTAALNDSDFVMPSDYTLVEPPKR